MNKTQRLQLNKEKLKVLQSREGAFNLLTELAEPYIKQYWAAIRASWNSGKKEYLPSHLSQSYHLKQLNKQYRSLLKIA